MFTHKGQLLFTKSANLILQH